MKLKEKFRQNLTGHLSDEKTEVDANIAEKIADDYAIEFATWVARRMCQIDTLELKDDALKLFKKEKGL